MNLGVLNETVILVDTDFLNERISDNLTIYKELYPNKNFAEINLADLLYKFAINARVKESGNNVDILFAYTLSNSTLVNCDPSNIFGFIDINNVQMITDIGTFIIRSFYSDETESCTDHFLNMLKIIYNKQNVSRIIMIADNPEINDYLEYINSQNLKSLLMLKKGSDSDIEVDIKYVNIDYPIAFALGLNDNEI
jgi:hypothetical protein